MIDDSYLHLARFFEKFERINAVVRDEYVTATTFK